MRRLLAHISTGKGNLPLLQSDHRNRRTVQNVRYSYSWLILIPMSMLFVLGLILPFAVVIAFMEIRSHRLYLIIIVLFLVKLASEHANQLQQSGLRAPELVCRRMALVAIGFIPARRCRVWSRVGAGGCVGLAGEVRSETDDADGFGREDAGRTFMLLWGDAAGNVRDGLAPAECLRFWC